MGSTGLITTPPNDAALKVVTPRNRVVLLDVSEIYRPENKQIDQFRIFDKDLLDEHPLMRRVFHTYQLMHQYQTVDFVKRKHTEWRKFDHAQMGILEALDLLNNLIDESDPDVDVGNAVHCYQTAERIRETHPDEDWLHLTGLVHDLGKVMGIWGEQQWAVVGDTFPVGCKPAQSAVFQDCTFHDNVDMADTRYNTKHGMYEAGCGLDNLWMSWGHDEYMYHVLKNHSKCSLPNEALYIIRFHSFYPWHSSGDYWHFANDYDRQMYYWIKEFNKFDLYSKSDAVPDVEELKPYYRSLVEKYIPGLVKF